MSAYVGARAYQQAARHRSPREQEADVFRRVNAALRSAPDGTPAQARALADNGRLWLAIMDAVRDPANRLPDTLRASVLSVALAVRREVQAASPDISFLIAVNEDMAGGLTDT